jgi:hypothetical protein
LLRISITVFCSANVRKVVPTLWHIIFSCRYKSIRLSNPLI